MENHQIELNILLPVVMATIVLFCGITFAFLPNKKSVSNKFLVLFFIMFFFMYVMMALSFTVLNTKYNWIYTFYFFNYSASLMLFLYVQTSLIKDVNIIKQYFLAFIPSVVFLFLTVYNIGATFDYYYLDHYKNGYHFTFKLMYELTLSTISLITLIKYAKAAKQSYSTLEIFQYKWIKFIVISSIVFSIYPRILALLSNIYDRDTASNIDYYAAGFVSLVYFLTIYIKVLINSKNTIPIDIAPASLHIEKSTDPTDDQMELYHKILYELKTNKVFQNPDINLSQLAMIIHASPTMVSKAINSCSGKTFYDLINSLRIKEATLIIAENVEEKLSIKEVMYQVGYNSKSSFNTAFKKYVGETPSDFKRKKQKKGSSLRISTLK